MTARGARGTTASSGEAQLRRLAPGVAEALGYYVYLYVHPKTGRVFYVGKGKGNRILSHMRARGASEKAKTIRDLKRQGLRPRLDILAHGLPDEETALRIEAAAIDLLELDALTNLTSGWKSREFGREPLDELVAKYGAKPVTIRHPVLLVRINRRYRPGMTPDELYESVRSSWKLGPRRAKVRFALAVYAGVVREVCEVEAWHPAGTTLERSRRKGKPDPKRWEFTGGIAPEPVRSRYVGRSVADYFRQGLQSPTVYVNC